MNQYDPSTTSGMAYDEIREGQRQQLDSLCPSDAATCSPSSDTPETDEQINGKPCTRFAVLAGDPLRDAMVPSEFARKLERERDEARRITERLRKYATPDMVLPWENAKTEGPPTQNSTETNQ